MARRRPPNMRASTSLRDRRIATSAIACGIVLLVISNVLYAFDVEYMPFRFSMTIAAAVMIFGTVGWIVVRYRAQGGSVRMLATALLMFAVGFLIQTNPVEDFLERTTGLSEFGVRHVLMDSLFEGGVGLVILVIVSLFITASLSTREARRRAAELEVAQAATKEAEQRFHSQYMSNPLPNYTWERRGDDFVLIEYNNAAKSATRGGVRRLLGATARELYSDMPEVAAEMAQCADTGQMIQREALFRLRSTGEERYLIATYTFAPPNRVIVHTEDLTERKLAEEEARRHGEEMARVTRVSMMGELASGIAHEINQPLAAIVIDCDSCQQLLNVESSPQGERLRELFGSVSAQANRAGEIVRRLRDLVRKAAPRRSRVDLNDCVRETIGLAESDLETSKVALDLKLDQSIPLVMVDRIQIEQVILNLVRNAVEAMQETEPQDRQLTVRTAAAGGNEIELSVSDTGMGLAAADADTVFDTFFTTKASGLGMGLAISRSIVEAHGGRIWVTPNADRGATFHFTVPVNPQTEEGDES